MNKNPPNNNKFYQPKNIYFKIIEGQPDRRGFKWKYLVDAQGVIWGLYATYKTAKAGIKILKQRYSDVLKERGTFTTGEE